MKRRQRTILDRRNSCASRLSSTFRCRIVEHANTRAGDIENESYGGRATLAGWYVSVLQLCGSTWVTGGGLRSTNERLNRAINCNLAPEVSAHEIRLRNNAYSAEVKPVSVPASGNGRVVVMLAFCVPDASVIERSNGHWANRKRRREGSWHTPHRGCHGRGPSHRSGGGCRGKEQKDQQRQYLLRSGWQLGVRFVLRAANDGDREGSFRRGELLGDELPQAVKIPVHFKRERATAW